MPFLSDTDILSSKVMKKFEKEIQLYEIFHENTKLNSLKMFSEGLHISEVLSDKSFIHGSVNSYKIYTSAERVPLDREKSKFLLENKDFKTVLLNRRTERNFINSPLSLDELGCILEYSYGINGVLHSLPERPPQSVRFSPSAGALYPLEIYILPLSVSGLDKFIYHYNVLECVLENTGIDFSDTEVIDKVTAYASEVKKSACVIFITSVFRRNTYKYGNRGYRFIHLDTGHLAQNISLVTTAIGRKSMLIGGFLDDEINSLLNIDGITEGVVYEIAIG